MPFLRALLVSGLLVAALVACRGKDDTTTSVAVGDEPVAPDDRAPQAATSPKLMAQEAPPFERLRDGDDEQVRVMDIGFFEEIRSRKPVGPRFTFPSGGGEVWGYLTINNPFGRRGVTVRWRRGDEVLREVPLYVNQNPRFRTWDFMKLEGAEPGRYKLEVLDATGELMAHRAFFVVVPPGELAPAP